LKSKAKQASVKKKLQVTYTVEENHPTPADEKEKMWREWKLPPTTGFPV
jgi:hypothetical protein